MPSATTDAISVQGVTLGAAGAVEPSWTLVDCYDFVILKPAETRGNGARLGGPNGPATGEGASMNESGRESRGSHWWYLLFIVQFVAVLWVPFYNSVEPTWAGVPFFYWYQLLWILIGAVLNAVVYFATDH